jgi:hypothetical protein
MVTTVESAEYYVNGKTQTLELTLELGKVPPQLADYLYGLRRFTVTWRIYPGQSWARKLWFKRGFI